jgi:hypothetical protein
LKFLSQNEVNKSPFPDPLSSKMVPGKMTKMVSWLVLGKVVLNRTAQIIWVNALRLRVIRWGG